MIYLAFVLALAALALAAYSIHTVQQQTNEMLAGERARMADWWQRNQSWIDNLMDRSMSKEFETYAQASYVEKPSDQPAFTAEGEYNAGGMAVDLLERLQEQQAQAPYDDDVPDLAEDWAAGPIIG